jgi:hypothetical protein
MGRDSAVSDALRAGVPDASGDIVRACLIWGAAVEVSTRWDRWNRFCGRSCAAKWMQRFITPAQRRQWGREGAKARTVRIHEDVIERFEKHGRQGYWLAYCAGREALKKATYAAQRRKEAS